MGANEAPFAPRDSGPMKSGSDLAKVCPAGDRPVSPSLGGAGEREARPGFRTRARRWNLALLAAVAAAASVVALSEPSGASSEQAVERAIALAAEGRLGEARKLLDPVLDLGGDHPRARLLDGILHAREGRIDRAIEIFERLGREHPEMPEPWNNLAVLFAVEGRLLEARNALEEALARRPDLAAAHANLSDVYAMLARHSRTRARALDPSVEDASPGEPREDLRALDPEEPPAPVPAAPSPPGPATEGASSSGAADSPRRAAPIPGGADAGDAKSLAKSKPDRDERWQSFLTLPGTSASAATAAATATAAGAGAGAAASPADHESPRESGSGPPTCFVATGFESPRAAAEGEAWLRSRGVREIDIRREERAAPKDHRVYLPPLKDRAAAVAAVYEMRDRGILDVAIINSGPLRNGVSLGVYRNAENALRRVARMEALGYSVRHAPGETGKAGYALAAQASGDTFPQLRAAWRERFPDRSIEPADCG